MPSYSPSTIARIGELATGIHVKTATLDNATYLLTGGTQTEIFELHGLLLVRHLYVEFITACSAHATQVLFNCTFTTPVIAVNAMCAKCAAITSLGQGGRIVFPGGAVATAAVITDSAGLSDVIPSAGHYVGGQGFVGTLGILASDASQASGTFQVHLHYFPMSDGAYAAAKL